MDVGLTYACNEHPEQKHDVQLEQQDMLRCLEVRNAPANSSKDAFRFPVDVVVVVYCRVLFSHVGRSSGLPSRWLFWKTQFGDIFGNQDDWIAYVVDFLKVFAMIF